MQNLDQTWIFYKVGPTHLTRTKHDLVDPDNSDDPIWFQPRTQQVLDQIVKYLFYN